MAHERPNTRNILRLAWSMVARRPALKGGSGSSSSNRRFARRMAASRRRGSTVGRRHRRCRGREGSRTSASCGSTHEIIHANTSTTRSVRRQAHITGGSPSRTARLRRVAFGRRAGQSQRAEAYTFARVLGSRALRPRRLEHVKTSDPPKTQSASWLHAHVGDGPCPTPTG
jgi:hypothetical protein